MKFTGQFQKQSASTAPVPFSTGMFRSRPFSEPTAQRSPSNKSDHAPLPLLNPDYNRMFGVQPKLTVGAPNDQYEQEADRVADQVMSMPDTAVQQPVQREAAPEEEEIQTKPLAASITPLVQREAMPEEEEVQAKAIGSIQREEMPEEEEVQTKSLGNIQREEMPEEEEVQTKPALQRLADGGLQAGGSIESQLNSSKGGGSPLPDDVRSFMEPRFGADFSQVRVHTGSEAVQMNRDLNAQAFTHQQDLYFGAGKAPGKNSLTAHELTHVIQQTGSVQTKQASKPSVQMKCSACEAEESEVQRFTDVAPELVQRSEVCDENGICHSEEGPEASYYKPSENQSQTSNIDNSNVEQQNDTGAGGAPAETPYRQTGQLSGGGIPEKTGPELLWQCFMEVGTPITLGTAIALFGCLGGSIGLRSPTLLRECAKKIALGGNIVRASAIIACFYAKS